MSKIENVDHKTLVKAVVVWTGYKSASYPVREDQILETCFPTKEAVMLAAIIRTLEVDFFKSQAFMTAKNLSEMSEMAVLDFRRLHPQLPVEIANAFAWCYAFDYK